VRIDYIEAKSKKNPRKFAKGPVRIYFETRAHQAQIGAQSMGGTPASFQPGDPDGRAAAAARKSSPGKRRKVEPSFLEKLKERGPAALEAIDRMLAKTDPAAARIVIDRLAPKALVEDGEVVKAFATLKDANDDLQRSMGEMQAELETERARSGKLETELQAARTALATARLVAPKVERPTHDLCGNA
jgi:hypothetical protein